LPSAHAWLGFGHVPQSSAPPQPSCATPQTFPSAGHVVFVHAHAPSTHACDAPQLPHWSALSHPSSCTPHVFFSSPHVAGLHGALAAVATEASEVSSSPRACAAPKSTPTTD
jgi:hypothetical protein